MKKRASEFSNVGEIIKFIESEKDIKIKLEAYEYWSGVIQLKNENQSEGVDHFDINDLNGESAVSVKNGKVTIGFIPKILPTSIDIFFSTFSILDVPKMFSRSLDLAASNSSFDLGSTVSSSSSFSFKATYPKPIKLKMSGIKKAFLADIFGFFVSERAP